MLVRTRVTSQRQLTTNCEFQVTSRLPLLEAPKRHFSPENPITHSRKDAGVPVSPQRSGRNERNSQHPSVQMMVELAMPTPPADEQQRRQAANSGLNQGQFFRPLVPPQIQSPCTEEDNENKAAFNLDSSQVRRLLLDIAWRYFSLQISVVDKRRFLSHREIGIRSQYFSGFLENSLLACASRVSTSVAIRNLGKLYVDRATQDIPTELECPTLGTIQGFLLLADFEATRGRDRLGWTYIGQLSIHFCSLVSNDVLLSSLTGIACRLLSDFDWHGRCEEPFAKDDLTSCDIKCLYTVFLSTFVYDTLSHYHRCVLRKIQSRTVKTTRFFRHGWIFVFISPE